MDRHDPKLRRLVHDKYWPRLDEEGKYVPPGKDGGYSLKQIKDTSLVKDPDVVWVGPFSDALVSFGLFADRQQQKAFFYELTDKGRATEWRWFDFTLERCLDRVGEWPYANSKYPPEIEKLRLLGLSGREGDSTDPGEIRPSPKLKTEPGDLWSTHGEYIWEEVDIIVDNTYGLHILYRGDRITKVWKHPRIETPIKEIFVLRPTSEGSSAVPRVGGVEPLTVG